MINYVYSEHYEKYDFLKCFSAGILYNSAKVQTFWEILFLAIRFKQVMKMKDGWMDVDIRTDYYKLAIKHLSIPRDVASVFIKYYK